MEYKAMPTLGFTHYQPAQWAQEFLMDLEDITKARADLRYRGSQGTAGTQALL
jgi:adenylosuccinate lyase